MVNGYFILLDFIPMLSIAGNHRWWLWMIFMVHANFIMFSIGKITAWFQTEILRLRKRIGPYRLTARPVCDSQGIDGCVSDDWRLSIIDLCGAASHRWSIVLTAAGRKGEGGWIADDADIQQGCRLQNEGCTMPRCQPLTRSSATAEKQRVSYACFPRLANSAWNSLNTAAAIVDDKKASDVRDRWSFLSLHTHIRLIQGHLSLCHWKAVKSFHHNILQTATRLIDIWEMMVH